MGLSPADRFTLIMFGLALVVGILGWLIKRVMASNDRALRDNSQAIEKLTTAVNDLSGKVGTVSERVARLEGPSPPRRRNGGKRM